MQGASNHDLHHVVDLQSSAAMSKATLAVESGLIGPAWRGGWADAVAGMNRGL
jgi:hypothetical protein